MDIESANVSFAFDTEAEAMAFAQGIRYASDKIRVLGIKRGKHRDGEGNKFLVYLDDHPKQG